MSDCFKINLNNVHYEGVAKLLNNFFVSSGKGIDVKAVTVVTLISAD